MRLKAGVYLYATVAARVVEPPAAMDQDFEAPWPPTHGEQGGTSAFLAFGAFRDAVSGTNSAEGLGVLTQP